MFDEELDRIIEELNQKLAKLEEITRPTQPDFYDVSFLHPNTTKQRNNRNEPNKYH